ncbi:MAG TPA: PEP-CTERM sorting domain-containing protein [Candidatus Eisenbacteria bacterium]|nr:PEP-CTERM sorting domain-containing protein [Candidatus Eisenbacteria bacterium]
MSATRTRLKRFGDFLRVLPIYSLAAVFLLAMTPMRANADEYTPHVAPNACGEHCALSRGSNQFGQNTGQQYDSASADFVSHVQPSDGQDSPFYLSFNSKFWDTGRMYFGDGSRDWNGFKWHKHSWSVPVPESSGLLLLGVGLFGLLVVKRTRLI